jgi:periplasmic protein TonB
MRSQAAWMTVSVAIHAVVAGVGVALIAHPREDPPIIIDFTIAKTVSIPAETTPPESRPPKPRRERPPVPSVAPQEVFPDTVEPDTTDALVASIDPPAVSEPGPAQPSGDGDSLNRLKTAYVTAQYGRIRDIIHGKVVYPSEAIDREWEGEVQISFFVHCDGRVDDIRITRSSGYPVLDNSAIDAVKRAAPFPPSPRKVEMRLPIAYKLE